MRSVSPGKLLTIGESWAYKTTAAEVSGGSRLQHDLRAGTCTASGSRSTGSILDVLFKLMHYKDFSARDAVLVAVLLCVPDLRRSGAGRPGPDRADLGGGRAGATELGDDDADRHGETFQELLAIPPDADGDGTPDSVDTSDTDGDGTPDNADACPQFATSWPVPAGDSDCDGYPDTVRPVPAPPKARSGRGPGSRCATTAASNDEPLADDWPPDFNDNQLVNGADILTYNSRSGRARRRPPYNARWDLNASGLINGADILPFNVFFGKRCL